MLATSLMVGINASCLMVPITFHSAVPVLFFCLLFSFSGLLLIMVATCLQCYLANACYVASCLLRR